jgi:hypothetical protein
MADFRDAEVVQIFNNAETRAEEWRLPKDTYGANIEEVPAKFLDSEEPEKSDEAPQGAEMSLEPENPEVREGFQDAPFKNAPPSTEASPPPQDALGSTGNTDSDEATAGNMSQADIEALIQSVSAPNSDAEPPADTKAEGKKPAQPPAASVMSQEDIESLLTGQMSTAPKPENQEPELSQEESPALVIDEEEQKESTRSLSEDEIANMFNVAQDIESEPQEPEPEAEVLAQAEEVAPIQPEPIAEPIAEAVAPPGVEDIKSEVPPQIEEPPKVETHVPPEVENEPSAQDTAQQLSEDLDTEALLSRDNFDESIDELAPDETAADTPPSDSLESELQALLQTEEGEAKSQAEEDTLLSREELSAMLKTPSEDSEPETPADAEIASPESAPEEPYADPEVFTEEKIQALTEHTNEISRQLKELEQRDEDQPESQFQPGAMPGQGKSKTKEAQEKGERRSMKIPLWSESSSLKRIGVLTTIVGLISASVYFIPPWLNPPPPAVAKVEHPSENWTWEKNPNQSSSVKYRIHAPGASVTLSSLVSLDSRSLGKMETSHINQYYERQRKRRKIQKFRFLNHVRYHKDPADPITRMIQYDYTFKDLQGRNHLIRSVFFGVGAQVFKLGIRATTNDAEGSSSSQVSQNLNQIFQDFLGLSRTSYLPEYFLEKEFKAFTKNSRYLAQRAIMLDR